MLIVQSIFLLPFLPSLYHPPRFLPYSCFFIPSFPSHLSPFLHFLSASLPFLSTPPFLPTSPFSPISSSLIPPFLSFRSLLSLLASFPSNPLFVCYSSINPTPSFSTPSFFPTPPFLSILPLNSFLSLLPLHFFLTFHSFQSLLPIIPFSFLSLLLFFPFLFSYPSFPCSPSSLPLPHVFLPLLPFMPFFLNTLSLPTPQFFPTLHSLLHLLSLLASFPSSPSVICYL